MVKAIQYSSDLHIHITQDPYREKEKNRKNANINAKQFFIGSVKAHKFSFNDLLQSVSSCSVAFAPAFSPRETQCPGGNQSLGSNPGHKGPNW